MVKKQEQPDEYQELLTFLQGHQDEINEDDMALLESVGIKIGDENGNGKSTDLLQTASS